MGTHVYGTKGVEEQADRLRVYSLLSPRVCLVARQRADAEGEAVAVGELVEGGLPVSVVRKLPAALTFARLPFRIQDSCGSQAARPPLGGVSMELEKR